MVVDNEGERERLWQLARSFVERGDRAGAIAVLEQALSSAEGANPALNSELARLCVQERRLDDAHKALDCALAVAPADPIALRLLARVHDLRGDYGKAADAYGRALAVVPEVRHCGA